MFGATDLGVVGYSCGQGGLRPPAVRIMLRITLTKLALASQLAATGAETGFWRWSEGAWTPTRVSATE